MAISRRIYQSTAHTAIVHDKIILQLGEVDLLQLLPRSCVFICSLPWALSTRETSRVAQGLQSKWQNWTCKSSVSLPSTLYFVIGWQIHSLWDYRKNWGEVWWGLTTNGSVLFSSRCSYDDRVWICWCHPPWATPKSLATVADTLPVTPWFWTGYFSNVTLFSFFFELQIETSLSNCHNTWTTENDQHKSWQKVKMSITNSTLINTTNTSQQ